MMFARFGAGALALAALVLAGSVRAEDSTFTVKVAAATEAVVPLAVEALAKIESDPTQTRTVTAPVSGTVGEVLVRIGDRVARGSRVASVATDPALIAQTLAAEGSLKFAEQTLEHVKRLLAQQLATNNEVAAAERDVAAAQANVAAARRLGSDQAIVQLAAEVDGVVSAVSVVPGQQVTSGTALVTISDPDALQVRPGIEPRESRAIRLGSRATITAVSDPSDPADAGVEARVTAIGSAVDPQTHLVPIGVVLGGKDATNFIVGQSVRVTIDLGTEHVISVPQSALEYDGNTPIVFVVKDGAAHRKEVEIASMTDQQVYLRKGLASGEDVVTDGIVGLADGAPVTVSGQ